MQECKLTQNLNTIIFVKLNIYDLYKYYLFELTKFHTISILKGYIMLLLTI